MNNDIQIKLRILDLMQEGRMDHKRIDGYMTPDQFREKAREAFEVAMDKVSMGFVRLAITQTDDGYCMIDLYSPHVSEEPDMIDKPFDGP